MVGGITEIPPMSSTVNSILDEAVAESGLGAADGPDFGVRGRGLCGVARNVFCSKVEHLDWLAEMISSMCGICIEFRLCSAEPAELEKT